LRAVSFLATVDHGVIVTNLARPAARVVVFYPRAPMDG
jgi:hypothetical protein